MTVTNPIALAQLVPIIAKKIERAQSRAEELSLMRQMAHHSARYVVIVTQDTEERR